MKRLGPIIEDILRRHNLWHSYRQHLVVESWPAIVGPELAAVTRADQISGGLLRVLVKDSVWAYHLSLMKPRIIKKINDYTGGKVVRDIFFQIDALDKKEK